MGQVKFSSTCPTKNPLVPDKRTSLNVEPWFRLKLSLQAFILQERRHQPGSNDRISAAHTPIPGDVTTAQLLTYKGKYPHLPYMVTCSRVASVFVLAGVRSTYCERWATGNGSGTALKLAVVLDSGGNTPQGCSTARHCGDIAAQH